MGQCQACSPAEEDSVILDADASETTPQSDLRGPPKKRRSSSAARLRKLNGSGGLTKNKNSLNKKGVPLISPGVHTIDLKADPLYCTISSDERYIIVSQRSMVSIYETATGKHLRALAVENASKVAISADSSFFIIPYSYRAFFICSFSKDGAPKKQGLPDGVHCILKDSSGVGKLFPANIAISKDGTVILTSNDSFELRLWRLKWNIDGTLDSHDLAFTTVLHIGRMLSLYISKDNSFAVSTARDCKSLIWSLSNGTLMQSIEHDVPNDVILVEEGKNKFLVCWSEKAVVRHISVKTGEIIFQVKLDAISLRLDYMATSPDHTFLVNSSFSHDIEVFDLQSGNRTAILEGHLAPILCYSISPSCAFVVTISRDKRLHIWNIVQQVRWGCQNPRRVSFAHHSTAKWI